MKLDDINAVERLLYDWADWMGRGGSTTDGHARKCPMAPDSRIHSIEDWEAENDQRIMPIISAAVYDLIAPQRDTVLRRFGLQKWDVWQRPHEELIYELAIRELHTSLSKKICV